MRRGGERHLAAYIHSAAVIIRGRVFVRAIVQPSRKERGSFFRETKRDRERTPASPTHVLLRFLVAAFTILIVPPPRRTEVLKERERVGSALA